MKKAFNFFVVLCFFVLFLDTVSANSMKYVKEDDPDNYFVVNKNAFSTKYKGAGKKYIITDFQFKYIREIYLEGVKGISFTDSSSQINHLQPNGWWSELHVCSYEEVTPTGAFSRDIYFNIEIFMDYSITPKQDTLWLWEQALGGNGVDCKKYVPERKLTKEEEIKVCSYYDTEVLKLLELLKNYESKDSNEKLNIFLSYEEAKERLKDFCHNALNKLDYDNVCLNRCIQNLKNDLKTWDDKVGKKLSQARTCGFSDRLILFIANIVKWIKYIIPVIVIVLGILDFIQVVSSEKDDGMKKAQGRFVKRLIAAALIFLIPFIIEFVLNKMGFAANGCGIIDL